MTHPEVPPEEQDSQRGEGEEPRLAPTKKDIRLWRRALRENWPISEDDRNTIIRDCMDEFIKATSGRDKVNLAKVIMLGDAINVKKASLIGKNLRPAQPVQVGVNVGVGVQIGQAVGAIVSDPEYLDWLRERTQGTTGANGDAHAVGTNGHGGHLPAPGSHNGNGQGSNGHDHGA